MDKRIFEPVVDTTALFSMRLMRSVVRETAVLLLNAACSENFGKADKILNLISIEFYGVPSCQKKKSEVKWRKLFFHSNK